MTPPNADDRTERLGVRMTTEEKEMLAALAKHEGLTSSDVIRLFIRRAYAETFGPKKSKK